MAFHPDFADNGRVFFSYTTEGVPLESHVAEFHGTRDGTMALGPPREILKPIPQFFKNHKGGDIKFGPKDGYLYISLGDGKTPGDELQNGQDTYSLSGKLLRIDVDPPAPYAYAIPADNPFAQGWGRGEVFAYGFRNMWRFRLRLPHRRYLGRRRRPARLGGAEPHREGRQYLGANCSHCHRPGGTAQAEMDLRNGIPLAQMNVCDVEPTQGDLGVEGARLVMPGNSKASILAMRPARVETGRMPPLGTSVVDEQGAALIASWIDTLKSCN